MKSIEIQQLQPFSISKIGITRMETHTFQLADV
jgi:hypothetical protein